MLTHLLGFGLRDALGLFALGSFQPKADKMYLISPVAGVQLPGPCPSAHLDRQETVTKMEHTQVLSFQ